MSSNPITEEVRNTYDTLAGTIIAAHGVQGGIKIRLVTKTSLPLISTGTSVTRKPADVLLVRSAKAGVLAAEHNDQARLATISGVRQIDPTGAVCLAKIQNLKDRTEAEALIGMSVFAPQSRRAPLQEDEFFVDDLIGLAVVGEGGQDYGKITSVLSQPANDVYETDQGALIPAVKAFVKAVDIPGGRVVVYDVAGLRPSEAEAVEPEPGDASDDEE